MSRDYLPRTSNVSQPTLSVIQTSPLCSARMMFASRKDSWNDLYRVCRILNYVQRFIFNKRKNHYHRKFIINKIIFRSFIRDIYFNASRNSAKFCWERRKKYFREYFVTPTNTIFLYGNVGVVVNQLMLADDRGRELRLTLRDERYLTRCSVVRSTAMKDRVRNDALKATFLARLLG